MVVYIKASINKTQQLKNMLKDEINKKYYNNLSDYLQ